jgi:alpha-tubulin suppressor-like RCC1 family protein
VYVSTSGGLDWESAGAPAACEPTNVALNLSGSGTPAPSSGIYDLVDGQESYPSLDHGVFFAQGGAHDVTVDFGRAVTFDQVTVHHRPDCGPLGHNVPKSVQLEVFREGSWHPLASNPAAYFERSYDLGSSSATQTAPCNEGDTPESSSYGALPDTYSFSPVTGNQVRWSYDGDAGAVVAENGRVSSVVSGEFHSCVLNEDGSAACWGLNSSGQLGSGTQEDAASPVQVEGVSDFIKLVAGAEHTCGLRGNRTVSCWGSNAFGQLGNGGLGAELTPATTADMGEVVDIAAGAFHTCAIAVDGSVLCWGMGSDGQLGNDDDSDSALPVHVALIGQGPYAPAVQITAGRAHTCATLSDGNLACWGANSEGQVGDPVAPDATIEPWFVVRTFDAGGTSEPIAQIEAGADHTCVLTSSGTVACWGRNAEGQLGRETDGTPGRTADVAGYVDSVSSLSLGWNHSCATRTNSDSVC